MKKILHSIILLTSLFSYKNTIACSIFTSSKNGEVLVGANEDDRTSFHHMWFVPAKDGRYGAVFFGQHNMQTQAGMNEHGLVFDFAAIPRIDSENRKVNFIPIAEILMRCKTVDEALELYQEYSYSSFGSQMLLADATGKSALVNADTVVIKTGDYQITTNFNICNLKGKSYDCWRYDKIDKALSDTNEISVPFFQGLLSDVHQEGNISTQYSNVYDLKNGKIYINWFHNYEENLVVDLAKELNKGFHIESLDSQFKQKTFAALNYQKSEEGYYYNKLLNEFAKNGIKTGFNLYEKYISNYPERSDLLKDNLNWIPYGLIARARTAYDNLSFDYYYIPSLHNHKTIWNSKDELLYQCLKIFDYINDQGIITTDFYYYETLAYTHMVLGNKKLAIQNYEKALASSEKGSREWIRANNTLQVIVNGALSQNTNEQLKYLKQKPPSIKPLIFAPKLVSSKTEYEFGSVFNKQGTEFFYGANVNGKEEIRYSKLKGDSWSEPRTLLSHPVYGYNDPFLSPDENRLYFISKRALDGKGNPKDYDIWYVEKKTKGWTEPINAGPEINSAGNEYYISFNKNGDMYFSSNKRDKNFDIYTSKYLDGDFQEPTALGSAINTPSYEADVFIDPNESYIIFCAQRNDGLGEGDLYISFKQPDGSWSESKNMGSPINTQGHELCPFVTADGKYLFYTSNEDIYWVSAKILNKYRQRK